jgi:non-heme chloroperoxidase
MIFQAATANLNPRTEAKVDTKSPDRGHSLTIDSGWREAADMALAFVKRST